MAEITRWFDVSASGAGDGTSWADRAALLTSGSWSSIITGFDFSGSDSLTCRVAGGNYTSSQALVVGLFANPPTQQNKIRLFACDSSGNIIENPGGYWTSDMPAWSESGLPVISDNGNRSIINLPLTAFCNGLVFRNTGNTTNQVCNCVGNKLIIESSGSNASSTTTTNVLLTNCVLRHFGSVFNTVTNNNRMINCRIEGNGTGSSGALVVFNTSDPILINCTIVGSNSHAVMNIGTGTGVAYWIMNNLFINNAGKGLLMNNISSQSSTGRIFNNVFVNNGGYAIDCQSEGMQIIQNNRMRNNTSGNITAPGAFSVIENNIETAGTDADEFVDAAAGDFRIKHDCPWVDRGIGVSRQCPPGGGGTRVYAS